MKTGKKTGKKVFLGVLITVLVGAVGLLGFGAFRMLQESGALSPVAAGASSQPEEAPEEGSPPPGILGGLPAAEVQADVLDNLAFAFNKSKDAVGWIQVPGTDINGLIMQAGDNYYYERRNEDGDYDIYGCYFADYECALGSREDFLQNTIVYGHGNSTDNPDGKRFSQLFRFTDPAFAREHPYVYISTMEGRFAFEIFSVCYTDTSFNYIQVEMDDGQKLALAQQAQALSLHDYGITVQESDRLLTLSTCSMVGDTDGTKRFILMGRLCPEGTPESQE